MPFSASNPPANNQWGVGYTVEKTPIEVSGTADAAPFKNRVFKIVNESKVNPVSGRPVGYKLVPQPSQLLLAHPESVAWARAECTSHFSLVLLDHEERVRH
jgi:primary-amine oxidase